LDSPEKRQFAYEMAVGVCDADDRITADERSFLDNLKQALQLGDEQSQSIEATADELISAADEGDGDGRADDAVNVVDMGGAAPVADSVERPVDTAARDEEVDGVIMKYAVLTAALELLPQSLATLAIVPLQTRLVYKVGAAYGHSLDVGHIKEFIGTVGIGLTSQYLEGFARKFLGGVAKNWMGSIGGMATSAATGGAVTFGTSYALGKVAKAYYSGGRTLSTDALRRMFSEFTGQASSMFGQYQGQIQQQAQNIDMDKLAQFVKRG
ncbi:MAG: hypothetical protein QF805_30345, partial [Pirellulaceae bacterium]|nr:hypothetical protein [Pirellulaceae bacterium]